MEFEWDEEKNRKNIKKHGVSFELATKVFFDDDRIEGYDTSHSDDEDRYYTIGKVETILFVVFTERKDNIRLISARPAEEDEINDYYQANDNGRS